MAATGTNDNSDNNSRIFLQGANGRFGRRQARIEKKPR